MQDFKRLTVWQAARRLSRSIYEMTAPFPLAEQFGLTAQMRRASVSICANIAEGSGRGGVRELRRFLDVAMGSVCEVECELILSCDMALISRSQRDASLLAVNEIRRMLIGFRERLADDIEDSRRSKLG